MEIQFVPSLTFTGNVPGYSYELQARGLGYYTKPHVLDEGEKGQQELRTLQIRTLTRELEVCQQLKQPKPQDDDDKGRGAEEVDDSSRMAAVNERECDIRLQLAMLMRLDVNAMWKVEQQLHPPLEDELQSGPSAPSSIATIQQALALLRGILLIDSNHARYFARPLLATTVHYYHCTTTTTLLPRQYYHDTTTTMHHLPTFNDHYEPSTTATQLPLLTTCNYQPPTTTTNHQLSTTNYYHLQLPTSNYYHHKLTTTN
jgi:hypothetical protein